MAPDMLKVNVFLLGVGIIKTHDKRSLKRLLVVLVQQRSLGVTNVQISTQNIVTYSQEQLS